MEAVCYRNTKLGSRKMPIEAHDLYRNLLTVPLVPFRVEAVLQKHETRFSENAYRGT